ASSDAKDNADAKSADSKSGDAKGGRRRKDHPDQGTLWVKDGDYVRPIEVQIGAADLQTTEVSSDDLKEGMEVVIGEIHAADQNAGETNPFAPQFFRNGKGGQGGQGGGQQKGDKGGK